MATREQNLLGYQIINKTNIANICMLDANTIMKGLHPITREPLTVWRDNAPDKEGYEVSAESTDIKQMITNNFLAITTEAGMVNEFTQRYLDVKDINTGIQSFSVSRLQVDDDIYFTTSTKDTISQDISLAVDKETILNVSKTFDSWIPKVAVIVTPNEHLTQYEQNINTFQDLLNAIGFELQGINSYNGTILTDTFEHRKSLIESRLRVGVRHWNITPQTLETNGFKAVLDYVNSNFKSVINFKDMAILGKYIDDHVPQLPLVRRWWNYGS